MSLPDASPASADGDGGAPPDERPAQSDELAAVVRRYHRRERLASGATVAVIAVVLVAGAVRLSLLSFLVLAAAAVVAIRAPVFRSEGSARLQADGDPAEVRAAFERPRPPLLEIQWGVADEIRETPDGAVYDLSYLFGLRSIAMTVERRWPDDGGDGDPATLELVVTAGDRPWGTYEVTVQAADDGGSVVAVTWASDRRFGLRQLPGWAVAERYRRRALAAQGFEVLDRDAALVVWSA